MIDWLELAILVVLLVLVVMLAAALVLLQKKLQSLQQGNLVEVLKQQAESHRSEANANLQAVRLDLQRQLESVGTQLAGMAQAQREELQNALQQTRVELSQGINSAHNQSMQQQLELRQQLAANARTALSELLAAQTQARQELNQAGSALRDNLLSGLQQLRGEIMQVDNKAREQMLAIHQGQQQSLLQQQQQTREMLLQSLQELGNTSTQALGESREQLRLAMQDLSANLSAKMLDFEKLQEREFASLQQRQREMVQTTGERLESMRKTVDEKLHETLERRLGESFTIVSKRLEEVQRGLGEMQNLANGVGDLKRVLSNVKTRGILGEIQLGAILEQILAPEQYAANVKTKQNSNDVVEYALRLPGKEGDGHIWLPIDAKFPQEDYLRMQNAYESGDSAALEQATRSLLQTIKSCARDISSKYIDVPHTTDFAIMFLPIEGLFAEVVRSSDLVASLQREYKVIVTGPTTLAAILNSLQMGFRTLAIQRRSSEVWRVLGAVKSEFQKFGTVLGKAQRKILDANKELDLLVGTRTNMMLSKLNSVEKLAAEESEQLLELAGTNLNEQLPELH